MSPSTERSMARSGRRSTKWLRAARWRNERGWRVGIDAVAVILGAKDGPKEYIRCHARHSRRIYAVKGVPGPCRLWERAKKVKGAMRVVNVAVDVATRLHSARAVPPRAERRTRSGGGSLFRQPSRKLVEQVTNERRRLRSWKSPGLCVRPGSQRGTGLLRVRIRGPVLTGSFIDPPRRAES